jgi:uncharacterized protein (TIGR03083 family)
MRHRSSEAHDGCREQMRQERHELRALLKQVRSDQWDRPTPCADWTVRDLAAHLLAWDDLLLYRTPMEHLRALGRFVGLYARSLASMTRLNSHLARRNSALPPDEITGRFGADDGAGLKWLFDGSNPGAHLAEYVIHHQDLCRALGTAATIRPERLGASLDGLTQLPGVRIGAWRKLRTRCWQATDIAWSRGRGPIVSAPAEEILMILAGRSAADAVSAS